MKIHKNLQQGTDEWRKVRAGKLTASNAQAISANGKGLESLVYETLAEKYSSSTEEGFSNAHTERGKELEETALDMYQLMNKVKVERVGFIEHDEYSGCSPDGLIGKDGGAEVKCHGDAKHFRIIVDGIDAVEKAYIWQVQMNLLVTGRKWWDLICYNPNFTDSLHVFRILPDKEAFEKLKAGLALGTKYIHEIENKLNP